MTPTEIREALADIRRQGMRPAMVPVYRLLVKRQADPIPKGKLSDDDVRAILELHNDHGFGYGALAAKFEVSKSYIQKLCKRGVH
jgi:hypothetical protein